MKKEKKKSNLSVVLLFLLFLLLLDILLFPTLLNKLLFPVMQLPELVIEGWAFMNWGLVISSTPAIQLTLSSHLLMLIGLFSMYLSKNKDGNQGNEHGSARFMTDEEFDSKVPNYKLRADEYNFPNEDISEKIKFLETSNVDIFSKIEFKEVLDNE